MDGMQSPMGMDAAPPDMPKIISAICLLCLLVAAREEASQLGRYLSTSWYLMEACGSTTCGLMMHIAIDATEAASVSSQTDDTCE